MTSQADVCNIACALLGVSPVTDIATGTTLQDQTFNSIWSTVVKSELRKRLWKFSITRQLVSNLYNTTLTAGTDGTFIGFVSEDTGSVSTGADLNGNPLLELADAPSGTPVGFYLSIQSAASLGQDYFDTVTISGGQVSVTLDPDNAVSYGYTGGASQWIWGTVAGLVNAGTYQVRLDSSATNLAQPAGTQYSYAYPIPSNSLRVIQAGDTDLSFPGADLSDYRSLPTQADYVMENGNILSSLGSPILVRFVQDVSAAASVAIWDAAFCDAIGARLARTGCFRITNSLSQQKLADAEYAKAIQEATRANAFETPPQYAADDSWILTRPIGSGGAPTTRIG